MDNVVFGRTGLRVSVAGLGGGGDSRLGLAVGSERAAALRVIHRAIELGVTYFDTAQSYGTESLFGEGLAPYRDSVILSSKATPQPKPGDLLNASTLRAAVENSLRELQTDHIDVYHLHRVTLKDYEYCLAELVPELERLRTAGKIGFIGLSEPQGHDADHVMLHRALDDDCWDAVMLFFTILNQSAREAILHKAIPKNIGVQVMSAARGPISHPDQLRAVIESYISSGELSPDDVDVNEPFGFLHGDPPSALIDAAYRFVRHEPGCHIVLTGTGNPDHLQANIQSISAGPLAGNDLLHIEKVFGQLRYPRVGL